MRKITEHNLCAAQLCQNTLSGHVFYPPPVLFSSGHKLLEIDQRLSKINEKRLRDQRRY